MADQKPSGSRPNRRIDFGKKVATARAFLRQAEALNRHEEKIAAHTAIQSWTAIGAAAIGTVTTIALIFITYNQLQSGQRLERLDYARSLNQYVASVQFGPDAGHTRPGYFGFDPENTFLPVVVNFERVRGESAIVKMKIRQHLFLLNARQADEYAVYQSLPLAGNSYCQIAVDHWYSRNGSAFESSDTIKRFASRAKLLGPRDDVFAVVGRTEILVTFYDVFGELITDRISVLNGDVTVDRAIDPNEVDRSDSLLAYIDGGGDDNGYVATPANNTVNEHPQCRDKMRLLNLTRE